MDRAVGSIVNHPTVLIHSGVRLIHGRGDDRRIFRPYGHAYFQFKRRIAVIVLNKEKRGIGNDTRIFRKQLFLDGERSVRIGEIFRGNVDDLAGAVLHGEFYGAVGGDGCRHVDSGARVHLIRRKIADHGTADGGNPQRVASRIDAANCNIRALISGKSAFRNIACLPLRVRSDGNVVDFQIRIRCVFTDIKADLIDFAHVAGNRSRFVVQEFTSCGTPDKRLEFLIICDNRPSVALSCDIPGPAAVRFRFFIQQYYRNITAARACLCAVHRKLDGFPRRDQRIDIVRIVRGAAVRLRQVRKPVLELVRGGMLIFVDIVRHPAVFIRVRQVDRRVFRPYGSAVVRREDRSHGKAHRHNDGKQDQPNFLCSCHKTSSLFL